MRRPGKLMIATVSAAILLAACGGADDDDTPPPDTGGETQTDGAGDSGGNDGDADDGGQDLVVEGPGITDDEIVLGVLTDLSGPVTGYGTSALKGFETYMQYINDQGGIAGRQIRVVSADHSYDPSKSVTGYQRMVSQDDIFGGMCFGSPTCAPLIEPIVQDNRPFIVISQAELFYDPVKAPIFTLGTPYEWEAAIMADYIVEEEGVPEKIGLVFQDDDFGRAGLAGLQQAAEYHGFEVVEAPYERGSSDFSAQVQNLQRADVDWVLTVGITREPVGILKAISDIGWDVKTGSAVAVSMDETVVELADPDSIEGYTGPNSRALLSEDVPGLAEMRERQEQYAPDSPPDTYFIYGYTEALVYAEALQRAVDSGELSPDSVIAAWETIEGLETGGLYAPITYGPDQHFSGAEARIVQVNNGELEVLTDWRQPESIDISR